MNYNKVYNYVLPIIHSFGSLSVLSFILNVFMIHPKVNVALYLLNILSLLGIIVILFANPFFIFNKFNYLPIIENMNVITFNIIITLLHVIPIYLFTHRNKLQEVFSLETIYNSIIIIFIYLFLFYNNLENIYPLNIQQLLIMCFSFYILFLGIHYILLQHLS
jgi:hypothetical protein